MPGFIPVRSRVRFDLSNLLFIASLLCMCLAEAFIIRGVWFVGASAIRPHHRIDLPLLVWTPALGEFMLLRTLRRHTKDGELSPALAVKLSSGLGCLMLIAYLLITRFAQITFR